MKISKCQMFQEVMKTMQPPFDKAKVIAAVEARMSQLPKSLQVKVNRHDYNNALYRSKEQVKKATQVPTGKTYSNGKPVLIPPTVTSTAIPTKIDLIKKIVKDYDLTPPYNREFIQSRLNVAISLLPQEVREQVEFQRDDIALALSSLERVQGAGPRASRLPPISPKCGPLFGSEELVAAKKLLECCGGSVLASQDAIKFMAKLLEGK